MLKKIKNITSLIILILIASVSNITLVFASEEETEVVDTVVEEEDDDELVGPAALNSFLKGSPFLTDAWEKQKLDKEDLIAMTMYMSSYTYPLIDNYNTAFVSGSSYGQQGKSSNKIIFQNEVKQTAIQEFLNTLIGNQAPETQDEQSISDERYLRYEDDAVEADNGITLKELLYGENDPDENLINFTFSKEKYVVGPESKPVVVYDGTDKRQQNLLYLSLMRTLNSEFRSQMLQNLNEWLIEDPDSYRLFIDDYGNVCINGLGEREEISTTVSDEDDEFIDNLQSTIGESNNLSYPVSNIIVLPNCMNSQIVYKLNLFSPFFLNDYLIASSTREGLYIADANYLTSKQNKISLVTSVQIGYQKTRSIFESAKKAIDYTFLSDKDDDDDSLSTYPYNYSVKSDIIYSYYDISGASPVIKYIFYDKNASSKYFNSSLNLNNLPITSTIGLNKDNNVNYNATRMMYLNYLLMAKKFYDSKSQVSTDLFTQDNVADSSISSSLFVDQNRKIDDLITDLWEDNQETGRKIDGYLETVTSFLVKIYETIISVPFGSSYISSIPIVSTIYSKLKEYYLLVITVLLGVVVLLGVTRGSILKTSVKGILCMSLIIAIPTIFDKSIDLVTTMKYGLLENSINNWILSENIKYTGMNNINQYSSYQENISDTTEAEKLDNTLLYIKSKSPVIVNNVSKEINDEVQNSTFSSQLLNLLAGRTSDDNKIASFQDAFRRWEMIIPIWDYDESREISKSLQIDSSSGTDKLIRKIDLNSSNNSINNYMGFSDISEALTETSNYFSGYESTINSVDEDPRSDASYASIESYQEVVKQTRYKRQRSSTELSELLRGTDGEEVDEDDISAELKTVYTLPKGIKGCFSIHNIFYFLDSLSLNTEDKYSSDVSNVDRSSTRTELNDLLNKYFVPTKDIESVDEDVSINNFNFYDGSKYDKNYGYFILSENVAPYFYTVWYDMLGNLTSQEIGYALFGEVDRDEDSKVEKTTLNGTSINSRNSILMKQSKTIDYLDLRELFTNVVPYMSGVSKIAKDTYPSTSALGTRYNYYQDNRTSWVFEANWAENLIDNFGTDMSNTRVFSEYALYEDYNADEDKLNDFEKLIQQFYIELTPLIEELYKKADRSDIDKSTLIRQMTVLSTLKFNNIFGILGGDLQPKQIITESLPFDSLWVKFLEDNNYENKGSNFLDMISRQKTTNTAFLNVLLAFILALTYYYCLLVLLLSTTLSVITIIYKALKNVVNPNSEYIPFMTGTVVLIFKIALLYILPQFVVQLSLTDEISTSLTKNIDPIFIYLIYSFIYAAIADALIPALMQPHVGKMGAFGLFNPMKVEDDFGGANIIEKVGKGISNIGSGIKTKFTGSDIPTTKIIPSSAFKKEEIKQKYDNKDRNDTSQNSAFKAQTAVSNYQEHKNNQAISEINKAIEQEKHNEDNNASRITPTKS